MSKRSPGKFPLKLAHDVFRAALYGYHPEFAQRGFKPDKDRHLKAPWKQHLHSDLWPQNVHKYGSGKLKPLPQWDQFRRNLPHAQRAKAQPPEIFPKSPASPKRRHYSTKPGQSRYRFGLDTLKKPRLRLVALPQESLKPGDWLQSRV